MSAVGWLTTTQAAQLLGVGRTTVWKWIVDGIVPKKAQIACGTRTRIARWWVEGQSSETRP